MIVAVSPEFLGSVVIQLRSCCLIAFLRIFPSSSSLFSEQYSSRFSGISLLCPHENDLGRSVHGILLRYELVNVCPVLIWVTVDAFRLLMIPIRGLLIEFVGYPL